MSEVRAISCWFNEILHDMSSADNRFVTPWRVLGTVQDVFEVFGRSR